MQLRRFTQGTTTLVLIVALILGSPLLGTPGQATTHREDMLPYELSLPIHDISLRPVGLDVELGAGLPACDEQGLFAVRFCEAFQENTTWNRVTIQVWDHGNPSPVPIGGKYTFMTSEGQTVKEGVFCEQTNTKVPAGAQELLVEVAHVDTLASEDTRPCGVAPFNGDVWLRWSSVGEPDLGTPPVEEQPKCICECDCHPVFGCECECRPAEGSDCECNQEDEE